MRPKFGKTFAAILTVLVVCTIGLVVTLRVQPTDASIAGAQLAHGYINTALAATVKVVGGEHRWRADAGPGMANIPVSFVHIVDMDEALRHVDAVRRYNTNHGPYDIEPPSKTQLGGPPPYDCDVSPCDAAATYFDACKGSNPSCAKCKACNHDTTSPPDDCFTMCGNMFSRCEDWHIPEYFDCVFCCDELEFRCLCRRWPVCPGCPSPW